jgi:hypothetical protein
MKNYDMIPEINAQKTPKGYVFNENDIPFIDDFVDEPLDLSKELDLDLDLYLEDRYGN